jgi:hypothetical protein
VGGDVKMMKEFMLRVVDKLRGKDVPEEISKVLPKPVMPREAVLLRRQKLSDMDEQTK